MSKKHVLHVFMSKKHVLHVFMSKKHVLHVYRARDFIVFASASASVNTSSSRGRSV